MTPSKYLALGLLVISLIPAWGQPGPNAANPPHAGTSALTRFNLDFPGGTPEQLVKAIEKATGKPLNAIIPEENAHVSLPPLRMNNVDVAQLFKTLELASIKNEAFVTATYYGGGLAGGPSQSYQTFNSSYGFQTSGDPTDDSIWYFRVSKPAGPPLVESKACRFYALAPYLDRGFTVDDITTAIQTGWKMSGDTTSPQISFHKETKLLIAVGEPGKLETIDAVLKALQPPKPEPARIDPNTGLPLPAREPKTGK